MSVYREIRRAEDAGWGVRTTDSAESAAAHVVAAPVLSIGPRSADQVGYDLAWEARLGRAEDWRRGCSLPGREVSMLTVGEDRPAAARPREAAAGRAPVDGVRAIDAVADWSAGSCQEASLRGLADPAVVAADEAEGWASYDDIRGADAGMVDE